MALASGVFTAFVDAGTPYSVSASFPAVARGVSPGYSGFAGGFPGYTLGGRFSGVFTGYTLGPAYYSAVGAFTGFTPGGWNHVDSRFPAVAWNGYARASGVWTGYASGEGATPGAVPFSGLFTGYVHRTTSSAFPAVAYGPLPRVSGFWTGYALAATPFSGVFPGAVPATHQAGSGLFVGYTSGY